MTQSDRAPGLALLLDTLDLETIEPDIFRTQTTGEPGGRVFGGELCAQALVAAERTAPQRMVPHSLHAYFLRPGDTAARVVFLVDRIHEGRSFCRRRVTATQHSKPILSMECSFSTDHPSAGHQVRAPAAPGPESCAPLALRNTPRWRIHFQDVFDIRSVTLGTDEGSRLMADLWFRPWSGKLDDRVSAAAVLTYFSDATLVAALLRPSGGRENSKFTSLDHVLWFHNEVRFDDWLYYAKSNPALGEVRGLTEGRIFQRDGTLIASVAQEALIHTRKES
jgi:acyl-CoA thioesterase-2